MKWQLYTHVFLKELNLLRNVRADQTSLGDNFFYV